jgi:hypothetical protein
MAGRARQISGAGMNTGQKQDSMHAAILALTPLARVSAATRLTGCQAPPPAITTATTTGGAASIEGTHTKCIWCARIRTGALSGRARTSTAVTGPAGLYCRGPARRARFALAGMALQDHDAFNALTDGLGAGSARDCERQASCKITTP